MKYQIGNKYLIKPRREKANKATNDDMGFYSIETLQEVKVSDMNESAIKISKKDEYSKDNGYSYNQWYELDDFDKAYEIVHVILDMNKVDKENK